MSSSNFNGLGHLIVTVAALAMCTALLLFGNANNPTVYVIASTVITYWFGASVLTSSSGASVPVAPVAPVAAPAPVNVPVTAPSARAPFLSPLTASVPVPTAPNEVQL